jgi:hypothetical protein
LRKSAKIRWKNEDVALDLINNRFYTKNDGKEDIDTQGLEKRAW